LRPAQETLDHVKVKISQSRTRGEPAAPVAIVEFSDYECPFCRQYAVSTFPEIEKHYISTGKVKYSVHNFPLTAVHPSAIRLAQLAECAGNQGKYWAAHERIFEAHTVGRIDEDSWFQDMGLDSFKFKSCMNDGATLKDIDDDTRSAQSLGLRGTPTFYLGLAHAADDSVDVTRVIRGAQPYDAFKEVIDELIRSARQQEHDKGSSSRFGS